MNLKSAHGQWSEEQHPRYQPHSAPFTQQTQPSVPLFPCEPQTQTQHHRTSSMMDSEPIPLSSRFAKLKRNMIACRERDVAESFYRLLRELRREADEVAAAGTDVVPTIDYFDIHDVAKAAAFRKALRRRGVAIIKRVIPPAAAQAWKEETLDYMEETTGNNKPGTDMDMGGMDISDLGCYQQPQQQSSPQQKHDGLYDLYWSPAQVRARADSRLLDAQRFAMATWHASDEDALVGPEYPVAYADRLRVRRPSHSPFDSGGGVGIHVDNGGVERWEPDGYGASGTYSPVFSGKWEDYDPWDSSPRLRITTDLYNRAGSCSMFRMFQGFLSLSHVPAGSGSLNVCPMLQLSTAYLLLRPFFHPRHKSPGEGVDIDPAVSGNNENRTRARTEAEYLHPNNWNLNVSQTSILHGAVPGYVHEVNSTLHPHLQLDRTMVSIPDLEPGDYVIWHPDAVHDVDSVTQPSTNTEPISFPTSRSSSSSSSSSGSLQNSPLSDYPFLSGYTSTSTSTPSTMSTSTPSSSLSSISSTSASSPYATTTTTKSTNINPPFNNNRNNVRLSPTVVLYIPACPLTQTNALYLARQRRSFLLGQQAPDFLGLSAPGSVSGYSGERDHAGRSGVQDVADAGGEEGLRSMGLAPWDEGLAHGQRRTSSTQQNFGVGVGRREREKDIKLLRLANEILFPDRFDSVSLQSGRR
ncbi:DUF1479-domain-containing protein [Poronia punctata]|nr:DUF1479-domain-containing protein [Poronia punctata]